jgi:hypothetical protein
MIPFRSPGDTPGVEARQIDWRLGVEYGRREWIIAARAAGEDGKKYYLLECVG